MIEIILRNTQGVYSLMSFSVVKEIYGIVLYLEISLYYGFNAQEVLSRAQERISSRIEEYTSINVIEVNIKARKVVHQPPINIPEEAIPLQDSEQANVEAAFGAPAEFVLPELPPAAPASSEEFQGDAFHPASATGAATDRVRQALGFIRGFFARK